MPNKTHSKQTLQDITAPHRHVLFFDGECGMCHRGMRFFIRYDYTHRIRYASLQSPLGIAVLKIIGLPQTTYSTLIFVANGVPAIKATAIDHALRELSLFWKILAFLTRSFPLRIRNIFYDWLAKYRKRLPFFKNACQVPSAEEKKWFLDL